MLRSMMPQGVEHVSEMNPEEQGLKPRHLLDTLLGREGLRDESRRTRIETWSLGVWSPSGSRVSEMNPEEQGLKQDAIADYCLDGNGLRDESRRTRIETLAIRTKGTTHDMSQR